MATIKEIEEKAKAYDELFAKAKTMMVENTNEVDGAKILTKLFPQLGESEDERIRKALIYHYQGDGCLCTNEYRIDYKDIRAWLEKQSEQILANSAKTCKNEQKPTDKVEPKFKAGDKIISTISNTPYYITEVCNGHYLTDVGCIIMFNAQDNFELVEQKPAETEKGAKGNEGENPNSAWTEDDEEEFKISIDTLVEAGQRDSAHWLKSLKDRYTWKPSEGQLECLGYAIEKAEKDWSPLTNNRIYLTLKALKEQLLKLRGSKV